MAMDSASSEKNDRRSSNDDGDGDGDGDDEDDDIIAIQERCHHDPARQLADSAMLEESRCYSPTQQRRLTPPSAAAAGLRLRQRLVRGGVGGGTFHSTMAAAAMMLSQQGKDDSSTVGQEGDNDNNDNSNRDALNESNAFASLQSFLEQQQLSLSLTQETNTAEETVEEEEQDPQQPLEEEEAKEELEQIEIRIPEEIQNSRQQICHENKQTIRPRPPEVRKAPENLQQGRIIPPETNNISQRGASQKIGESMDVEHTSNNQNTATNNMQQPTVRIQQEEEDRSFVPMFQTYEDYENEDEISRNIFSASLQKPQNYPRQQTSLGLDRELQRQRQRRKAESDRPNKIKKYHHHKYFPSTIREEDPYHSLLQRLEKQRQMIKKTSRSRSTERRPDSSTNQPTHKHQSSSSGRSRSHSPKPTTWSSSSLSCDTTPPSKRSPAPVQTVSKSLVGSRPAHWKRQGASKNKRKPRGPMSRLEAGHTDSPCAVANKHQQRTKQLAAVASAKSQLLMPLPPQSRRRNYPNNNNNNNNNSSISPLTYQKFNPMDITSNNTVGGPNNSPAGGESPMNTTANTSFKPDFLPSGTSGNKNATNESNAMVIDHVEDTFEEERMQSSSSDRHGGTAAVTNSFVAVARANNPQKTRRRPNHLGMSSSDAQDGPSALSLLLQEVRSEIRTDNTRLRSGEYPFPSNKLTSRFDLYDPRNRATSYMDVTILGDVGTPWRRLNMPYFGSKQRSVVSNVNSNNMTIVGYIHTHHIYPERDEGHTSSLCTATAGGPATNQSLAWFCFSGETINAHSLLGNQPRGYQLRIYNAVVIPACQPDHAKTSSNEMLEEPEPSYSPKDPCRHTVLCTQLCEPYPSEILGPLKPSASELLLQLVDNR
jgi:hypothetical protein